MPAPLYDLYTFRTPNGRKVSILLEELELPYAVHVVDIGRGDQFQPDFVALNPNSKIPVLVDRAADQTVFESGAILIYLAEAAGRLLPSTRRERFEVLEWLMFQMGGVGPMFGQLNHFKRFAPEPIPYAIARYEKETLRLYGVLNQRLQDRDYVAGDYSIADIALYPWVAIHEFQGLSLDPYPHLAAWVARLAARPAVQRGMAVPT